MIKKALCILLLSILLLPILPIAATVEQTTLFLSATVLDSNERVTVTVSLDAPQGITSVKLKIEYDPAVLALEKAENQATDLPWFEASQSTETNPYVMVWVCAETTTVDGNLATLTFRAIGRNDTYETTVRVSEYELWCDGASVTATVLDTTVPLPCEHVYGDWEVYDDARHVRQCARCKRSAYEDHDWTTKDVTTPPTHTTEGIQQLTCTCGHSRTESIPPTDQHEFVYQSVDDASHKQVCPCGEETASPHTWDSGTVIKEPTADEEGVRQYTCTACQHQITESIPKSDGPPETQPGGDPGETKPGGEPGGEPTETKPGGKPGETTPSGSSGGCASSAVSLPAILLIAVSLLLLLGRHRPSLAEARRTSAPHTPHQFIQGSHRSKGETP